MLGELEGIGFVDFLNDSVSAKKPKQSTYPGRDPLPFFYRSFSGPGTEMPLEIAIAKTGSNKLAV